MDHSIPMENGSSISICGIDHQVFDEWNVFSAHVEALRDSYYKNIPPLIGSNAFRLKIKLALAKFWSGKYVGIYLTKIEGTFYPVDVFVQVCDCSVKYISSKSGGTDHISIDPITCKQNIDRFMFNLQRIHYCKCGRKLPYSAVECEAVERI